MDWIFLFPGALILLCFYFGLKTGSKAKEEDIRKKSEEAFNAGSKKMAEDFKKTDDLVDNAKSLLRVLPTDSKDKDVPKAG